MLCQTIKELSQFVEFGAGGGDNAPLLRTLGFTGVHFILDLPRILLLQQYFIRLSNWPVCLGEGLRELNAHKTILDSAESNVFSDYHFKREGDTLNKSFFMATWSLTESPFAVRRKMLKEVEGTGSFLRTSTLLVFGTILEYEGINIL